MPSAESASAIIAYIPVLHRGYTELFKRYESINTLYILSSDLIKREKYLKKDLRALTPENALKAVVGLKIFGHVEIIDETKLLSMKEQTFVMPDDDLSHGLADDLKLNVVYEPVFLRWDRRNVNTVDNDDDASPTSESQLDASAMAEALKAAGHSSDIWRRVGAVIITNDSQKKLSSYNAPIGDEHKPWIEGDPRNVFNRGVAIEMSTFMHAEARLIAKAAKDGIALNGATIYVTTYPCPACAKLIAESGIKKCLYKDGYAVLDGKQVLLEAGVELVKVQIADEAGHSNEWVTYQSE